MATLTDSESVAKLSESSWEQSARRAKADNAMLVRMGKPTRRMPREEIDAGLAVVEAIGGRR